MQTFNSFASLYNAQPLTSNFGEFAGNSENDRLSNQYPAETVENAYSEQEKQRRIAMYEKEMDMTQREIEHISHIFGVLKDPRKQAMYRPEQPYPLSMEEQAKNKIALMI